MKKQELKHEFVDLGLSVKWASVNVGADSVEDFGSYLNCDEVDDDFGRMPTAAEWEELRENCEWCWGSVNEVKGYVVKSKQDGNENCIFLPAAGLLCGDVVGGAGRYGYYLSSTPDTGREWGMVELIFSGRYRGMYCAGSYKRSVRLVKD